MQDNKDIKNAFVWSLLFCFFLAGIFFKLKFWKRAEPITLGDLYFYQGLAIAFLNRDWAHFWHFHFYPVYPMLMAWFHQAFNIDLIRSARWLNIIFDSLCLFPVFLIAREFYGKRAGLFAAMFWSFCWPYFRMYGDPEPVYAFFIFIALYLVLKKGPGWKSYAAAISLAGFSGLIKSEATFFAALITLIYFFRGKERLRGKVLAACAGVLIYLAFTSPIWVKYYQATGTFNPNPKSKTLYFIHNPVKEYQLSLYGLREDKQGLYTNGQRIYIEGDKAVFNTPLAGFVKDNFKLLFYSYFGKLGFALSAGIAIMVLRVFPGAFLLVILYFVRRAGDYRLRDEIWLWLWALLFLLSLSLFQTWERFFYPFFPVVVIISAKGLDRIVELCGAAYKKFFPQSRYPALARIAEWAPASLFILWFLFFNLWGATHYKPEKETAELMNAKSKLAERIKPTINSSAIVMCRGFPEPFSYFLEIPYWQMVITPMADVEDVIKYGRGRSVDYFFTEESDLARNPIVEPFLWGEVQDDSIKLLRHVPEELAGEYYPASWYQFLKSKPDAPPGPGPEPQNPQELKPDNSITQ